MADSCLYKTRILRNNLKYRDATTLKLIYNCYIRSRLFYCSHTWNQKCAAAKNILVAACKQFWRLGGFGRPPEVLTVQEQLFFNDIVLTKRIQSGNAVVRGVEISFSSNEGRRSNTDKVKKQRKTTRFLARNEYSRRISTYWNWLPQEIRTLPDSSGFKARINALIIQARSAVDTRGQLPALG